MNIKGASRGGGQELAAHLGNAEKNEKVTLVRVVGTVAQDLPGAFAEMETVASGTRCRNSLYHAKISPDPKEPQLSPEQWDRAVQSLAKELGLDGHAYAFVLHQKYGKATPDVLREHGHVVWLRVDPDTMRTAHDGHNYRKHELVSRQLEKEFGHARIQGVHVERDGQPRPERTPPEWAMQQASRTGVQPESVADTVKRLWTEIERDAAKLPAALREEGLTLATGNRDLVILDPQGGIHTLRRCLDLKAAELRAQTTTLDRSQLPTVEQARETIRDLKAAKEKPAAAWDRDQADAEWTDALINAAIDKEKVEKQFADPKPEAGTLPPPHRRDPIQVNTEKVEKLLADPNAELQIEPPRREPIKVDTEALKDKLAAYGFDASKPDTLETWQRLSDKVDAGRMTEKERLWAMSFYMWDQGDRERRAETGIERQSQRGREPEPDRDR